MSRLPAYAVAQVSLWLLGAAGWLIFVFASVGHIVALGRRADPPLYWLYDWHVYYAGAVDLVERNLYRVPLELAGWPLPTNVFNLPPAAAGAALPLVPFGREVGGIIWLGVGLAAIGFAAIVAARIAEIPAGWAWMGVPLVAYTGVYFFIGHVTLGNVNHVLLGVVAAFVWAHFAREERIAGVMLGLAVAVKLWPAPLFLLLWRERRREELQWAIGTLAIQTLLYLVWLGPDVVPRIVDALRTAIPISPESPVLWTTWAREVLGTPGWLGPLLAAGLLLIPARGRLGLGLGILAGLTVISNIWDHYLPAFIFAGVLIGADAFDLARRRLPLMPATGALTIRTRQLARWTLAALGLLIAYWATSAWQVQTEVRMYVNAMAAVGAVFVVLKPTAARS